MKALQKSSLILLAILATSGTCLAQGALNQLLKEAQTAYQRGELESARAKFESAIALDPKNPVAIGFLRQIQVKLAQQNTNPERALAALIVPKVEFKDAELSAVLDALRQLAAKLSDGRQSVNFVAQLSPEQAKLPISLTLANVPFTEVLKYIGTLASVSFTYDKYAIIVRPASAAPAPTPDAPK